MTTLRLLLGDQLSRSVASLRDVEAGDVILMVEVQEEATYVPHHRQKIVLILSAMRHFAARLRREGLTVEYVRLDDAGNTGSFTGELRRAVERHRAERVVVTEPGEWRVLAAMRAWEGELGVPVEIREDDRFLCSHGEFAAWAEGRRCRSTGRTTSWRRTGPCRPSTGPGIRICAVSERPWRPPAATATPTTSSG
jgi:deoxyribodipyrimidine photolyase-related protein